MDKKYGFYTEEYENGATIETLMTGDGKSQFTDIDFKNGEVAMGMSYGNGKGLGTIEKHPEGTLAYDVGVKWQVKFEKVESIDAMIRTLWQIRSIIS